MSSFNLRLANVSDIDAILNIEQSCFKSDRLSKRQFRYLLTRAKAKTWVLVFKGEIFAYCMLLLPDAPRPARIYSLAVLPACRGKGMAQQLIRRALREVSLRQYKTCVLEVRASDRSTIYLYEKYGFIIRKEMRAYYEDDGNALRMSRTFENKTTRGKAVS